MNLSIAGYREILYYDPEIRKGYVVRANRKQILKETAQLVLDCIKLLFAYRKVRSRLLGDMPLLTSEATWCEILGLTD